MTLKEKFLFHQVHPAKLATDIAAALVSLYFLWQHQLVAGLLAHFIPPPLGSTAVIRFFDVEPIKTSSLGIYLAKYMTPRAQMARLAGDLITVVAAWYHSVAGLAIGFAVILAAWTYGLFFPRRP